MRLLARKRGEADAYLLVDGKDIEEKTEIALRWSAQTATWSHAGDAQTYRLSKARQEIVAAVGAAKRPTTPSEVTDALNEHRKPSEHKKFNNVKKPMWEMSNDAQLRSPGDGRYSLPVPPNPGNPTTTREVEGAGAVTRVTLVTRTRLPGLPGLPTPRG